MMHYVQETDSRIVYAAPPKLEYFFTDQDETFGGRLHGNYLTLPSESNLLRPAWESIHRLEDRSVANEAGKLLSVIQETISTLQKLQLDLGQIPQLRTFLVGDGSVLFEWIFNDYRIGFNVERNPQESGWYLITNERLGEITAAGLISGINLGTLILWLLNFIVAQS